MYGTSPQCAARIARRSGLVLSLGRLSPFSPLAPWSSPSPRDRRTRRSGLARGYASKTGDGDGPKTIAVLGGGLTGLTTAYWLSVLRPASKITLYEASDRLGGWVDSEQAEVRGDDGEKRTVVWERGPRTVLTQHDKAKWDDLYLYDLIGSLNLTEKLQLVPKAANLNRYIYYPDHLVSVNPPVMNSGSVLTTVSNLLRFGYTALTEPLFAGAPQSIVHWMRQRKAFNDRKRQPTQGWREKLWEFDLKDVSIGHFHEEQFGDRQLVDNLISAMIHGIYGGDVWNLSMESSMFQAMLMQSQAAQREAGPRVWALAEDVELANYCFSGDKECDYIVDLAYRMRRGGYLSFPGGFSTLTQAIADHLARQPNVTIKLGERVQSISLDGKLQVSITTNKSTRPASYDKAVSTMFARDLANISDGALPALAESEGVTIQLVNLWYPKPLLNAPHNGFGYLVPQTVPFANNPEAVLGVLFDSDREIALGEPVHGTSLTVMMGGHLWDGMPEEFLPDAQEATKRAVSAVSRQLGIPESERVYAGTKLCRMCIPQHRVGHYTRMARADRELQAAFRGRLLVAGTSYTLPGVLTSIRAGRDAADQISGRKPAGLDGLYPPSWAVGDTGLHRFRPGRKRWLSINIDEMPLRRGVFPSEVLDRMKQTTR
ncbi:Protoporphyrinogen oxidase [Thozetella sp. PMI_491]|nr:Protoporphyrinogen oxidase [Thozetella sp. PMI_491]